MNSAIIGLGGIVWLYLAYRFYGRFIERRLMEPDDSAPTPAHRLNDGVDYYPAKPLVLFGHHFSSIAGAGPIVGPVIAAAAFGYGLSLLWILLGVIVVGAVHDYTALLVSVRHDGLSIPEITKKLVGPRARLLFQVFVWLTLVFVVAVFAIAAAKSFVADPRIVIPAFGLIPLAMVFGVLVNRLRMPLPLATIAALVVLAALLWAGNAYPVELPFPASTARQVWIGLIMLYGFCAAVLPVWLLLQPRDYIAYWLLAFGMVAGFFGLFVTHLPLKAPFLTGFTSKTQGPLWPMLFILIACGAVSGFHSLVASGTTAKQLDRESHARFVGFGGMVTEGALALLALLAVTAGLAYHTGESSLPALPSFLEKGGGGPIGAFSTGFGTFTEPFLGAFGALFGMTMLNAFVLTTLDTSVRLGRFITVELVGPRVPLLRNRFVATALVASCAFALAATGSEGSLWPMFGAANQLVAALTMIVVSAYLVRRGKPTIYTLVPALFMLLTTCGALVYKGYAYLALGSPNYLLAVAAAVLLVLGIYVGFSGVSVIRNRAAHGTSSASQAGVSRP